MTTRRNLNHLVAEWLTEHAPTLLEGAAVLVAVPRKVTKGVARKTAQRWLWNVSRVAATHVLLVALDHAPGDDNDIAVAECYRVPSSSLSGRRVLAKYRVAKSNKVGSFLDDYLVKVSVSALATAGV